MTFYLVLLIGDKYQSIEYRTCPIRFHKTKCQPNASPARAFVILGKRLMLCLIKTLDAVDKSFPYVVINVPRSAKSGTRSSHN